MSVRRRLIFLVLAVLIPAALSFVAAVAYVYQEEKKSVLRSLRETTRALSLVVDREFRRREATLKSLAASGDLDRWDLESFAVQARHVARSWDTTITLSDVNGRQLFNTRQPVSVDLPRTRTYEQLRHIYGEQGTLVSDLYWAALDNQYSFGVQVPVVRDGRIICYLSMGSFASHMQSVMDEMRLPTGWLGVVVDRKGVVVARSSQPEAYVGKSSRPEQVRQLLSANQGFFETLSLDGQAINAFFSESEISGWRFVIGIQHGDIGIGTTHVITAASVAAIVLLSLAVLLALRVGQTIAAPIQGLARSAELLGRGEPVHAMNSGLHEADQVSQALADASQQIRSANQRMEQRVAEAVAESERSQQVLLQGQKLEALGRLTGGIAHDFNNLLQTLSTGLHLADWLATDSRAKSALVSCKRALDRAVRLTRQLMAFGRGQASEARRVDLRDQLLAMDDLLKGALPTNINLAMHVADQLWPVYMDPLQFELAVLNLALNARDAMPGGGELHLRARNVTLAEHEVQGVSAGAYVALSLQDTGGGMPADVVAKAFDPFFTTKEVGKGSGLGLPQVYGFAKQAGGGVRLESDPGRGTSVTLYLPRTDKQQTANIAASASAVSVSSGDISILFVEDDVLVRDIVAPALTSLGFKVIAKPNADEALAVLESNQEIGVVVSDVVMPGSMGGIDLAAHISERRPDLAVILTTGYSKHSTADTGFRTIAKPYQVDMLAQAIKEEYERVRASLV